VYDKRQIKIPSSCCMVCGNICYLAIFGGNNFAGDLKRVALIKSLLQDQYNMEGTRKSGKLHPNQLINITKYNTLRLFFVQSGSCNSNSCHTITGVDLRQ
jgi:hypothetical protein